MKIKVDTTPVTDAGRLGVSPHALENLRHQGTGSVPTPEDTKDAVLAAPWLLVVPMRAAAAAFAGTAAWDVGKTWPNFDPTHDERTAHGEDDPQALRRLLAVACTYDPQDVLQVGAFAPRLENGTDR